MDEYWDNLIQRKFSMEHIRNLYIPELTKYSISKTYNHTTSIKYFGYTKNQNEVIHINLYDDQNQKKYIAIGIGETEYQAIYNPSYLSVSTNLPVGDELLLGILSDKYNCMIEELNSVCD